MLQMRRYHCFTSYLAGLYYTTQSALSIHLTALYCLIHYNKMAFFKSVPAFVGLKSSLAKSSGSQDLLFLSCFSKKFRSSPVQSGVLIPCASLSCSLHKLSLCTLCTFKPSFIWRHFNLSLYLFSVSSSRALESAQKFPESAQNFDQWMQNWCNRQYFHDFGPIWQHFFSPVYYVFIAFLAHVSAQKFYQTIWYAQKILL